MGLTNFPNGATSFGIPVIGGGVPSSFGNYFFVDAANGSDGNAGTSPASPFKTLTAAYNAATTDNDDVISLRGTVTFIADSPILWAKNRIHVVGMDGTFGRVTDQGARVATATTDTTPYVIRVTGTRNSFSNIKFIQNSTQVTALSVVEDGGEGTVFVNCSGIFGVSTNLNLTTSREFVMGGDSGLRIGCSWGTDVLLTSGARAVVSMEVVPGGSADGAKSNRVIDEEMVILSSSATANLLRLSTTASAKFLNKWIRPQFSAVLNATLGGAAITDAIQSKAGFVEGSLHFYQPAVFDCTNGCSTVTDHVRITAPVASSNSWESVTAA